MSAARANLKATTVGNYAIFAGGVASAVCGTADIYDESLVRTIGTSLSVTRVNHAAATIGNYALFGGGEASIGGYATSGKIKSVEVYTVA